VASVVSVSDGELRRLDVLRDVRVEVMQTRVFRGIAEEVDRRGTSTKICAGIVSSSDFRFPALQCR
jgi:hypothetical protein